MPHSSRLDEIAEELKGNDWWITHKASIESDYISSNILANKKEQPVA